MKKFVFSKFSPSGNTTLFLHGQCEDPRLRAFYCRAALGSQAICAEQAAFASTASKLVQMGAGEFCANACRAFGAMLDMEHPQKKMEPERYYAMHISGNDGVVGLEVQGSLPQWRIVAKFGLGTSDIVQQDINIHLVHLPGISHLLVRVDDFPDHKSIAALANNLRELYGLGQLPASGIVWYRQAGSICEILPHVSVPKAGTSMLESSCGSASLAVALNACPSGSRSILKVAQPCGEALEIAIDPAEKMASLGGAVHLCARGVLWLPDKLPGTP